MSVFKDWESNYIQTALGLKDMDKRRNYKAKA